MNNRNLTKIFIAIFMVTVFIPFLLVIIGIKTEPMNKNGKKINLNFKRDFPLKGDLVKLHYNVYQNIFKANSLPKKAILGDDDWKFVGDDFQEAFSEALALETFSKSEINSIKNSLISKKKFLDSLGIKLYITVPQNKLTIYHDKLPIKKLPKNDKIEQIDSLCKTIDITFINLKKDLLEGRKKHPILYYKTDTHWNDYAGLIAHNRFIDVIAKDFKNTTFKKFSLDELHSELTDISIGDLHDILGIDRTEQHFSLEFNTPPVFEKLDKTLPVPEEYEYDPNLYEYRTKSKANNLKILVNHDSFYGTFSKYFVSNFGETLSLWNYTFYKDIIINEKPDIVFYEIVGRKVDQLNNLDN